MDTTTKAKNRLRILLGDHESDNFTVLKKGFETCGLMSCVRRSNGSTSKVQARIVRSYFIRHHISSLVGSNSKFLDGFLAGPGESGRKTFRKYTQCSSWQWASRNSGCNRVLLLSFRCYVSIVGDSNMLKLLC